MYINIKIFDLTGNEKGIVEVPDDVPVNRIIAVLTEKLKMPRYSNDGQLISYKFHHIKTHLQLLDNQTLKDADVNDYDSMIIQAEIIAGIIYEY